MGWDNHIADPDEWESYLEAALGIWDDRDKTVPPAGEDDECGCESCA